jgi:glucokinase
MILAGDIGGTHTRLALFDEQINRKQLHVFDSKDYRSLEEPLAAFVGKANVRVNGACFGIAGPVVKGVVKTTNLPWTVEIARLARELQLPDSRVHLINDLQANASGIACFATTT